jgi:hypothetical protein
MNHFLLLCSPFVRILPRFIAISTTFLRQAISSEFAGAFSSLSRGVGGCGAWVIQLAIDSPRRAQNNHGITQTNKKTAF